MESKRTYEGLDTVSRKNKTSAHVAIVKGTVSRAVTSILHNIPEYLRNQVKEITNDLAPTMYLIIKRSFPKATIVSDRFHVQKLATDPFLELRIKYKWEAIDLENEERELVQQTGQSYITHILANGNPLKLLLARSRYLLFKSKDKWTASQRYRSEILFE